MRTILLMTIPALLMAAEENTMTVKRMTTNLYTDDVAACVKFWVERLHFEKTMEVPEAGGLAFAALQKGNFELMYGSYASLEKQDGAVPKAFRKGTGFLFLEVDDLNAAVEAMKGVHFIAPVHKTFYGSTEFTVTDPAGHFITFAHFEK